jgi:protein-tyrosine phosphatase
MLLKATGPVTVFDLRQEDHGFINGEPVSWYATNNWANAGKTQSEIVAEETARLAGIKAGDSVTLSGDSAKKSQTGKAPTRTEVVASASIEAEIVRAAGASYVRIAVNDHARPTDEAVDRFILAVRALPPGEWVHFHCRAGRGRTTTFMALYDMVRNARNVSLRAIVDRQSLLAGDYDLLGKEKEPGTNAGAAADRANFVRAFYEYAQQNPGGSPRTWTQWLASQP